MGNFKLKESDDYQIPDGEEVNLEKKLKQLVLLEKTCIVYRLQFNEKFLALRLLKRDLIVSIQQDNRRVRAIDQELGEFIPSSFL